MSVAGSPVALEPRTPRPSKKDLDKVQQQKGHWPIDDAQMEQWKECWEKYWT